VVMVDNYDAHPSMWHKNYLNITLGPIHAPGQAAIANVGRNGNPYPPDPRGAEYLYSITAITPDKGTNFQAWIRFPLNHLNNMSQLTGLWEYWSTSNMWIKWAADPTYSIIPKDMAMVFLNEIGTIKYHAASDQWINVCPGADAFFGGGAAYRLSANLTGPYTPLATLYQTPETDKNSIYYNKDAWCYAEFQHPEYQRNDQELAFTYCCNGHALESVLNNNSLYRAEMVRVPWPKLDTNTIVTNEE